MSKKQRFVLLAGVVLLAATAIGFSGAPHQPLQRDGTRAAALLLTVSGVCFLAASPAAARDRRRAFLVLSGAAAVNALLAAVLWAASTLGSWDAAYAAFSAAAVAALMTLGSGLWLLMPSRRTAVLAVVALAAIVVAVLAALVMTALSSFSLSDIH